MKAETTIIFEGGHKTNMMRLITKFLETQGFVVEQDYHEFNIVHAVKDREGGEVR